MLHHLSGITSKNFHLFENIPNHTYKCHILPLICKIFRILRHTAGVTPWELFVHSTNNISSVSASLSTKISTCKMLCHQYGVTPYNLISKPRLLITLISKLNTLQNLTPHGALHLVPQMLRQPLGVTYCDSSIARMHTVWQTCK